MDFKCDELILGKKDADSRALTFKWPSSADELLSLSSEQINWLLDGYDISLMQGHKTLHYETL